MDVHAIAWKRETLLACRHLAGGSLILYANANGLSMTFFSIFYIKHPSILIYKTGNNKYNMG